MFSYDNQSISISFRWIWLSIGILIALVLVFLWRLPSPNLFLGETQLLWSRRGSHGEWATKKVSKNYKKKTLSVFKIALLLWVTKKVLKMSYKVFQFSNHKFSAGWSRGKRVPCWGWSQPPSSCWANGWLPYLWKMWMMSIVSLIPTLAKVRMVNPQIQKYFVRAFVNVIIFRGWAQEHWVSSARLQPSSSAPPFSPPSSSLENGKNRHCPYHHRCHILWRSFKEKGKKRLHRKQ